MNKEELIKIFSAYLPYRLEFKLPLSSDRYDDITEGSWWRVAHTLETAIESQIPEALELRDMVMCQQDPYLAIEDDRVFLGYLVTNLGFELDDIFLDEVKPVLYDLSHLTREELIKANFQGHIDYLTHERDNWIRIKGFETFINDLPHGHFHYLLRNHYNVFNIPSNQFINKATLNK